MTQTIVNLGTGGAALNGQNGSTSGADSNDALFLDWSGLNYVYQPGVINNYMSVPDEAALDITEEIDIRVHVALDDWVSGARQTIFSKWRAPGNNRSWILNVEPTGIIGFQYTANGSSGGDNYLSTVAPTVSNGDALWIRVTWIRDNGSGLSEANHYTSTDGSTWAALGSTITSAITTAIFSGTGDIQFSAFNRSAAKFYRAQIFDGIDGTKVLDVDTSVITTGAATSFTALTGQTVTIGRSAAGRKTVAVVSPVWLFGTDDYMEVANNDLLNFGATDSFTVLAVVRQWATPASFGTYVGKRSGNLQGFTLVTNGTSAQTYVRMADGTDSVNATKSFTEATLTTIGFTADRSSNLLTAIGDAGFGSSLSIAAVDGIGNSVPMRIGRDVYTTAYQDFELLAVAVFRRTLSATEITAVSTYYQNKAA